MQNNLQVQVSTGEQKPSSLVLFDFSGKRLRTFSVQNGLQTIDVSILSEGTYFLQLITASGQIFNERFAKKN